MEIKIAKPIETLEYLRDSGTFPFSTKEGVLYRTESIDEVIDNMHKYKKIEKIVKAWTGMNSFNSMVQISEVIEDGDGN
ncbi:MAG: hypothetical protein IKR19_08360 [Acholeplasmatales bacterium]|nr:hypothetical protein [Acholeplasmatales bacterium]